VCRSSSRRTSLCGMPFGGCLTDLLDTLAGRNDVRLGIATGHLILMP